MFPIWSLSLISARDSYRKGIGERRLPAPFLEEVRELNYHRLKTDGSRFRLKTTKELFRSANRSTPFANLIAHSVWREAEHIIGKRILKARDFTPECYIKLGYLDVRELGPKKGMNQIRAGIPPNPLFFIF